MRTTPGNTRLRRIVCIGWYEIIAFQSRTAKRKLCLSCSIRKAGTFYFASVLVQGLFRKKDLHRIFVRNQKYITSFILLSFYLFLDRINLDSCSKRFKRCCFSRSFLLTIFIFMSTFVDSFVFSIDACLRVQIIKNLTIIWIMIGKIANLRLIRICNVLLVSIRFGKRSLPVISKIALPKVWFDIIKLDE